MPSGRFKVQVLGIKYPVLWWQNGNAQFSTELVSWNTLCKVQILTHNRESDSDRLMCERAGHHTENDNAKKGCSQTSGEKVMRLDLVSSLLELHIPP